MDKQPLNTGEQKDMTEFFTDLIGKIEEMSPVLVRELCFVKPYACKRTQRCWPTIPNVVGCCMLRPFADPVANCGVLLGVVAQNLKPI